MAKRARAQLYLGDQGAGGTNTCPFKREKENGRQAQPSHPTFSFFFCRPVGYLSPSGFERLWRSSFWNGGAGALALVDTKRTISRSPASFFHSLVCKRLEGGGTKHAIDTGPVPSNSRLILAGGASTQESLQACFTIFCLAGKENGCWFCTNGAKRNW